MKVTIVILSAIIVSTSDLNHDLTVGGTIRLNKEIYAEALRHVQ